MNANRPPKEKHGEILVLGIDPGSRCTGWGLVREVSGQASLVATGTIRPNAKAPISERLGRIFSELQKLIREHGPDEAAIEDVFTHKNVASALKLGQARGAIMACCALEGLDVSGYDPPSVKKTVVGVGRADKAQVAFMVARILGVSGKQTWPQDASDALAVAVCHLNTRRLKRLAGG